MATSAFHLLAVLIALLAVMAAAWAYQRARDNGGWVDVFWTFGTGAILTVAAFWPTPGSTPARRILVAAMVSIWSLRLGWHIFRRVRRGPEDSRYAQFRRDWGVAFQRRMAAVTLVQAPASAILSISVILAAGAPGTVMTAGDATGLAIWAVALVGEAEADRQLRRFKSAPRHEGAICETGLWAWSRHPNYFFEALGWLAYPALAVRLDAPWSWAAFSAPVFMFLLLRFGSGVPPLEEAMLRSRGEAWLRHRSRVPSAMFPLPPKRIAG